MDKDPGVPRSGVPEAEPCPFCGGPAYVTRTVNGTQMFKVGCTTCGVEMKAAWYRDQPKPTKDILALWNRRAEARSGASALPDQKEKVK
jgi:Lar family restriction alleviation protein